MGLFSSLSSSPKSETDSKSKTFSLLTSKLPVELTTDVREKGHPDWVVLIKTRITTQETEPTIDYPDGTRVDTYTYLPSLWKRTGQSYPPHEVIAFAKQGTEGVLSCLSQVFTEFKHRSEDGSDLSAEAGKAALDLKLFEKLQKEKIKFLETFVKEEKKKTVFGKKKVKSTTNEMRILDYWPDDTLSLGGTAYERQWWLNVDGTGAFAETELPSRPLLRPEQQ